MLDWIGQNWGAIYGIGALIGFSLFALAAFVSIWWFAAARYELGGLVLGWIPGAVAALIVGLVAGLGWPLVLAGLLLGGSSIIDAIDDYAVTRR